MRGLFNCCRTGGVAPKAPSVRDPDDAVCPRDTYGERAKPPVLVWPTDLLCTPLPISVPKIEKLRDCSCGAS